MLLRVHKLPPHSADSSCGIRPLRVLLKGPCDMSSVLPYVRNQKSIVLETEFNYVNDAGAAITAMNHSIHILEAHTLSDEEKLVLLRDVPFMDMGVFKSRMIDEPWDFVFMSLLPDCHEGVYRHKESGHRISFSSFNYDLTDRNNWDKFISGAYTNHNFHFTKPILERFSECFEFEGCLPSTRIVENMRYIRNKILSGTTRLIFVLGSEVECEQQSTQEFAGHASRHREVNRALQQAFADADNVDFIRVTELIRSQADFNGCTNHFSREIYYHLAQRICDYIKQYGVENFRIDGKASFLMKQLVNRIFSFLRACRRFLFANECIDH